MFDARMRNLKRYLTGGAATRIGRYLGPAPITLGALVLGLASAVSVAAGLRGTALIFWVLNRFVDGLDGEVARTRGESSDFGGYIDMMSDVVVYASIPLALAHAHADAAVVGALLAMMAAFYVNITSWSYLSALLEKRLSPGDGVPRKDVTSIEMPWGLIEGAETIVIYGILIVFPSILRETALVAAAAGLISTVQRVVWAYRMLRLR